MFKKATNRYGVPVQKKTFFSIKKTVLIAIIAIIVIAFFYFWLFQSEKKDQESVQIEKPTTYTKSFPVGEGDTYGLVMERASTTPDEMWGIFNAAEGVYSLANVRLGRNLDLIYDINTDKLQKLIYRIDSEDELHVALTASTTATSTKPIWVAKRVPIDYETKINSAQGIIETSMYDSAMEQNIDEIAVINFADVFQWTIDFAWEVQKGDSYKFIFEDRYRNGQYVMPGKILAGKFVNQGKPFYAFYYMRPNGEEGYFDEKGNSVEKMFLKAPVAFKYISSGYTTGRRYVEAFNVSTGHRAIDYAASYGSPIQAVGDGVVIFARYNGPYGNMVKIRHNSVYQTNYGHMSKFAVKTGQLVTQGQTIGYVGSTGFSTGPHVHFEMVKNGTKINPLKEEFPSTEGIKEENLKKYLSDISNLKSQLE